jgi:Flp pilus assembly protein TadG
MSRRRRIHDERGQTMVEFALVLPVLCIVLFSIIQFGILYNDYLTVTDAARVGARKAATSRNAADPVGLAKAAARASATGVDQSKLDVFVTATAWAPGADVTVEVRYPYNLDIMGVHVKSGVLSSETTERVE